MTIDFIPSKHPSLDEILKNLDGLSTYDAEAHITLDIKKDQITATSIEGSSLTDIIVAVVIMARWYQKKTICHTGDISIESSGRSRIEEGLEVKNLIEQHLPASQERVILESSHLLQKLVLKDIQSKTLLGDPAPEYDRGDTRLVVTALHDIVKAISGAVAVARLRKMFVRLSDHYGEGIVADPEDLRPFDVVVADLEARREAIKARIEEELRPVLQAAKAAKEAKLTADLLEIDHLLEEINQEKDNSHKEVILSLLERLLANELIKIPDDLTPKYPVIQGIRSLGFEANDLTAKRPYDSEPIEDRIKYVAGEILKKLTWFSGHKGS